MLQTLVSILGRAEVEIVILILLLVGFFAHWKDTRLLVSGVRFVRTFIVVLIFFCLFMIWNSLVNPSLRPIAVFGMFLLNLFMLYNLILARLERPYHKLLAAITQDPEKHELIHEAWVKGKRFYYLRYAWSSLFSGANPAQFLQTIATERVRNDIKGELHRYGVQQKLISLPMMAGYLKRQAACDENLPADFKDLMIKTIDDFAKHPWIEEQANVFLTMVTETPEDLHFPEWMEKFESCVKAYKK
jgi:hypothetical protein